MNRILQSLFLTSFILLAAFVQAYAQQHSNAANEADIASIRTEFKRINASTLKKEQFEYESSGCVDGGLVQYFLDKGKIVKIIESGSIGDGSWTREFYYQSGNFIFSYEVQTGGPAIGPETKTEHRIYAKNGHVVRYMENQQILAPDSQRLTIITTAAGLLKAYHTKEFADVLCK
jgi:hypothetical protein